jgi:hypothetical protein
MSLSTDWPFDLDSGEPPGGAPPNVLEFTVTELAFALKRTLEDAYGYVRVRAEIGRVTNAGSGHCYLDLKDDRSVISAVIWKNSYTRLRVKPQQGLEVIVTGKVTTFPNQSKYQILIDTLEAAAFLAKGHRRRHVAYRGSDPGYPAPACRPLSPPGHPLARARSGGAMCS